MSLNITIHEAQTSILRELLFVPEAGYAKLQKPTGLTSDHFNFHIGRLVELGIVEKRERGRYRLTARGKEYANKLDTDNSTIERQPKVAVMLVVERFSSGRREFILQERLKNPYYGYWGFPTGKIRWGESIAETAARELEEETGLVADYRILGLYHEHTYSKETGESLEDKMFFAVLCANPTGELLKVFEGGRNEWLTIDEARKLDKKFASFETELEMIESGEIKFVDEKHFYTQDEF